MAEQEYRASETSGAAVTLYTHGDDPIFADGGPGKFTFTGTRNTSDLPSLVSVSTSKALGAPSGQFTITLKAPINGEFDLRRRVIDDDWIDIVLTRHGQRWHVMRGLVDDVRRNISASGGPTVEEYVISGRDFGKIFTDTEVWFNSYTAENVGGGPTLRALAASNAIFGNVAQTVKAFLFGFLTVLDGYGRATWVMPPGMPGLTPGAKFAGLCRYLRDDYSNVPARVTFNASMLDVAQGNLWGLAQNWSDPPFCELWTDLVRKSSTKPGGVLPRPGEPLSETDTAMAVILRDRPFPSDAALLHPLSVKHPFFALPTATVERQSIMGASVGRGGAERFNAYFATNQLAQEHASNVNLTQPLWDRSDILRHGVRRMDPSSNYIARNGDLLGVTSVQRAKIRDWHCLNPYFYNGTLSLAHGRPDIRVGMRARIPGISRDFDETYYVESVSHTWQFGAGIRTTLGVTRGWVGTDQSMISAIAKLQERYKEPEAATPGAFSTPVTSGFAVADPTLDDVGELV